MAKRKNKSVITQVMSAAAVADNVSSNTIEANNADASDNTSVNLSATQMQLEQKIEYDDCVKTSDELLRLSKENSELTDKLAEYINENNKLNDKLKKSQAEYDEALVKISELSFQVATLTAELNEMSNSKQNTSNKNNNVQQSTNVTYNMYQQNGYSSWN